MSPYQIMTWTINRAVEAPHLGIDFNQLWPYAPYQQMIDSLQFGAFDVVLFLCLAALTLLLVGAIPDLGQLALLAGLFMLPYWALMAGGLPLPASVLPAQFAQVQVKVMPVVGLLSLALAFFMLCKQPRLGLALVLLLMALLMVGRPLLGLLTDEAKRKAIVAAVQTGLAAYTCGLALFAGARKIFLQRWHRKGVNDVPNGV